MNTLSSVTKLSAIALFAVFLSGCFFQEEALIAQETLNVESGDSVEVSAREGGDEISLETAFWGSGGYSR